MLPHVMNYTACFHETLRNDALAGEHEFSNTTIASVAATRRNATLVDSVLIGFETQLEV